MLPGFRVLEGLGSRVLEPWFCGLGFLGFLVRHWLRGLGFSGFRV